MEASSLIGVIAFLKQETKTPTLLKLAFELDAILKLQSIIW
jgi:hypothetical protein